MKRYFKILIVVLIVIVLFGGAASLRTHKANAADSIDRETFFERVSGYASLYGHGQNCLNEFFYSSSGSYLGQTCQGYARKMTDYVFGTESRNGYASGWVRYNASSGSSQISNLSIGDMVRYKATSYCDHTIFVTAMYGEYIEYTDCNSDNAGTVKWNQITTRDDLAEKLKKKLVYDPGYYGWIAHYTGSPFAPASRVPVANERQVILFEHINYEGSYRVLETGTYSNPASMGFGNDSLSSVKVGAGVKVKLGEHDNFNGRTQTYYSNVLSLVGTYIGNDTVSSVAVELYSAPYQTSNSVSSSPEPGPRQVILFEHINYEGAYTVLETGAYSNPASMGFGNDSLSSVKIGSEVKIRLGEHDNFNGRTQTYYSSVSSLVGTYIGNDTVSSVKVSLK